MCAVYLKTDAAVTVTIEKSSWTKTESPKELAVKQKW